MLAPSIEAEIEPLDQPGPTFLPNCLTIRSRLLYTPRREHTATPSQRPPSFFCASACYLPHTDTPVQGAGDDEILLRDADHVRYGVGVLGPQVDALGTRRDVLDLKSAPPPVGSTMREGDDKITRQGSEGFLGAHFCIVPGLLMSTAPTPGVGVRVKMQRWTCLPLVQMVVGPHGEEGPEARLPRELSVHQLVHHLGLRGRGKKSDTHSCK